MSGSTAAGRPSADGYGHQQVAGVPPQRRAPPITSHTAFSAGMGQVAAAAAAGLQGLVGGQTDQQRTSPNRDRCKVLLVIDEPHMDWSVLAAPSSLVV